MTFFAQTPEPPYVAVIFTAKRTAWDEPQYRVAAAEMEALAARQDGYLGIEAVRGDEGVGITVSYWRDMAAVKAWKKVADHQKAQRAGKENWYAMYDVRIATVERAYSFMR